MRLHSSEKLNFCVFVMTATAIVWVVGAVHAQTRKPKEPASKPPVTVQETSRNDQEGAAPTPTPAKRNERPGSSQATQISDPPPGPDPKGVSSNAGATYKYEFSQPEFVVSSIKIEHDPDGAGTISFKKKGSDEAITDPIRVSPKSVTRINDALAALDFLSSTENYQYEKDYSHLGVTKFAFSQSGRSRAVTYSWTENKDAKALMDEYRKIGNQYIWIFDISLSRENQPLDAPRLLDSLDSMIKRNEISDPHQMEPFLRELSNDERIPLIARNHAARLVAQFEKEKKKGSK